MTRDKLRQYLLWSGFEIELGSDYTTLYKEDITIGLYSYDFDIRINDDEVAELDFDIPHDDLLKIIEILIGEKLITEAPKPSIKEQLKDVQAGDFITLNHRYNDNKIKETIVLLAVLDNFIYFTYQDGNKIKCNYYDIDKIVEISEIQHNNFDIFNKFNKFKDFCNEWW